MLITLSPAKILDFKTPILLKEYSTPIFCHEAEELNLLLESLTIEELAQLLTINPKQALEVYQWIHTFRSPETIERQAILAYNGIAYQGFGGKTLKTNEIDFAQKHIRILSGLYGMLRPLDYIKPYRLDLNNKLKTQRGKTLYDYWSHTLTRQMAELLEADDNTWINLSSSEYTKAINKKDLPLGCRIITPLFKQFDGNSYKQVIVYAKKARGMMARFVVDNAITDCEYLKAFDCEEYCFAPQLSSKSEWIFIR